LKSLKRVLCWKFDSIVIENPIKVIYRTLDFIKLTWKAIQI
jgi:hypothetical protein